MLLKDFEKRWLAVFAEGISKKQLEECMYHTRILHFKYSNFIC